MRVYWLIEGIEKSLYTAKGVRIIKDKQTGKEYAPNKMEFFKKMNLQKILQKIPINMTSTLCIVNLVLNAQDCFANEKLLLYQIKE